MAATRKMQVLAAMVVALAAILLAFSASPAQAQTAPEAEGAFRLNLSGALPKGQTFVVRQAGMDADPTAAICKVGRSTGLAQRCVRGANELPFVAEEGTVLRYKILRLDARTGEREVVESGRTVVRTGTLIQASFRAR